MSRRNHRRTTKPFRKRENRDLERIQTLDRRELRNLEDCRRLWEEHADPLALVFGLLMAEVTKEWPWWLVSGLLLALCAEDEGLKLAGLRLGPRWKATRKAMNDAKRATAVLAVRHDPTASSTWTDAFTRAATLATKHGGADPVGAETVRNSYSRAIKGLADEGQYWQAETRFLSMRLLMALQELPTRHQERLSRS